MIAGLLGSSEEVTPDEVVVLDAPWSSPRPVQAHIGSITIERIVPNLPRETRADRVGETLDEIDRGMRVDAAQRGANALTYIDCELDPFWRDESTRILAVGFALRLAKPTPAPSDVFRAFQSALAAAKAALEP